MRGHACKQYVFQPCNTSTFNAVRFAGISTAFIPCRKFGSPTLGKGAAAARAALPIPISVCSSFVCPNNGMAASVWDLCAQTMVWLPVFEICVSRQWYGYQCLGFVCPDNGMAASVRDLCVQTMVWLPVFEICVPRQFYGCQCLGFVCPDNGMAASV